MNTFCSFHPLLLLAYFISVFIIPLVSMHPIILICTLTGGILYFSTGNTLKVTGRNLVYYLVLFILISVINPLVSHNGEKILFFMNDNPMTLESIIYGAAIGIFAVSIIFWCKNFNRVVSVDKVLYLLGSMVPKLSVMISMLLRIIPVFKEQMREMQRAQITMGYYTSDSIVDRILNKFRVLNAVSAWVIENMFSSANFVKSRGLGLKGRTHFSIYRFQKRDGLLAGMMLVLLSIVLTGIMLGDYVFYYYPTFSTFKSNGLQIVYYSAEFWLLLLPFIIETKGELHWRYLRSKI